MAAEAAVLGTPSIRFNDFVGELAYLEELEHRYDLTFGIRSNNPEKMLNLVRKLSSNPELKSSYSKKRATMLLQRFDTSDFMVWFLTNYPHSKVLISSDSNYYENNILSKS